MNHQEKQKALSNFTSRLQGILNKTKAAIKDKKTDDFFSIDYEFKLLKQDFQKQSGKCAPHDQAMFQFGQVMAEFESIFDEHNPFNSSYW
ncbi:MAG: hypothetical protein WC504_01460 [Methylobacter sp.]